MSGTLKLFKSANTEVSLDTIQFGITIEKERWSFNGKPAHRLAITNEDIPKAIAVENHLVIPNKEGNFSRAIVKDGKAKKMHGSDVKNADRVREIFNAKDKDEKSK